MSATSTEPDEMRRLLTAGAPRPLISRAAEQRLGERHGEVLDGLERTLLDEGLSGFTVAQLAARMGCSRRTLYELAPSKEQLQLVVLDRLLHRLGRQAVAAVDPASSVVEQLRQYVTSGIDFAFRSTAHDDLADVPAARRLLDRHHRFASTIIERMINVGIARGELRVVNPSVVAAVVSTSAVHLAQPEVLDDIGLDLAQVLDEMFDALLGGLRRRPDSV